jgi:hypothetical protein
MPAKKIKPTPVKRVPLKRPAAPPAPTGECIAAEVGCPSCPCGGPFCGQLLRLKHYHGK